jgi:hypothetical protein
MSFREKSAWVTLCALLLVCLLYFIGVPYLYDAQRGRWVLHALLLSLIAFVLMRAGAHIVLRLRHPQDARTPRDERERLIDLKARGISAHVYIVLSLVAIFVSVHILYGGPGAVAMSVLMALVAAEIVNCTARIIYYRRSS